MRIPVAVVVAVVAVVAAAVDLLLPCHSGETMPSVKRQGASNLLCGWMLDACLLLIEKY